MHKQIILFGLLVVLASILSWRWLQQEQGSLAHIPKVGGVAPDFRLPDQLGAARGLYDYKGRWVVLYFYPEDGSPGCTTEACAFRDAMLALQKHGVQVLGVSLDSVPSHAVFARKNRLPFPILSDVTGVVSRSYGAVDRIRPNRYAYRYTFLITPHGRIAKRYLQVDPQHHVTEILHDLTQIKAGSDAVRLGYVGTEKIAHRL